MSIDPVTLAILKGRFEQIADEMDATLFRSAFNPIIAEAHDASHGVYAAETGETPARGKSGLPIFVGVMAFAVKAAIDKAATRDGAHDGGVWIFNAPYGGGTHLSEFRLVKPVLRDGRCSAFSPRWGIGSTWAARRRAIPTRRPPNALPPNALPPNAFRKAC